jgi:UrcA family protein
MYMTRIALTLAALTFATAAIAGDGPVFRWAPDDLTTLNGVAATHQRVEDTAKGFCKHYLRGTRGINLMRSCVSRVSSEIVAGVADPRLTAYAESGKVDDELLAAIAADSHRI